MSFVIVYIMDISGFLYSATKFLYNLFNPHKVYMGQSLPKPFGCFVCMVFWCVLGYLLYMGESVIYSFGLAAAMSFLSVLMSKLMRLVNHLINKIEF